MNLSHTGDSQRSRDDVRGGLEGYVRGRYIGVVRVLRLQYSGNSGAAQSPKLHVHERFFGVHSVYNLPMRHAKCEILWVAAWPKWD